jgi:nucleotide-binding universal stress UspA family protein
MNIDPKYVLWPTDFSENSLKAARYAMAFCKAFDAQLHVVNVAPILVWSDNSLPLMTGGDMLVSTTDTVGPAKVTLEKLLRKEFGDCRNIKSKVLLGYPWREICSYAKENRIDLIVVATHGLTGLKHLFTGSTAERIVQHAPCPVLTVKSFEREFIDQIPAIAPARTRRQRLATVKV